MSRIISFIGDCTREALSGSRLYWSWVGGLLVVVALGIAAYAQQLTHGLVVTHMSDQVSWGVYIANFTFLVGMAAAAVMVVLPAYIFHNKDAKRLVVLAEGVAVAACLMALLFVIVDLGRPDRFWHMLPFIGRFNWPISMLSWDVIVLSGYLGLNIFIPAYVLFCRYGGREPNAKIVFPASVLSIAWAFSIHTVTAFLFSSSISRPFWHTALLAPRFLASAFAAGPAAIIVALTILSRRTAFRPPPEAMRMLAVIATVALQINLFMVFAEVFTEFYSPSHHSASAYYLFFGLGEATSLVPWIYSALTIELVAVGILMVEPWRENQRLLIVACCFSVVGIWIEKGMGLIIPGFIPTPLGEVLEYTPSWAEVSISFAIWAIGFLAFTVLAKVAIPIEIGTLRDSSAQAAAGGPS